MSDIAMTIPAALRDVVEAHGGREAVVDGEVRLTWRVLGEAVEQVGGALVAAGVGHGDRVAIWGPNSWRWVVASLATTTIGAVLVPISSRNVGREAADLLDRSGTRVLFVHRQFLGRDYLANLRAAATPHGHGDHGPVPGLGALELVGLLDDAEDGSAHDEHPAVQAWSSLLARSADVDRAEVRARGEAVAPDDVADIIFTSGTTGRPKGVICEHGNNLFTYAGWRSRVGLRTQDRYLVVNPMSHSFGYKAGLLACVQQGTTLVSVRRLRSGAR